MTALVLVVAVATAVVWALPASGEARLRRLRPGSRRRLRWRGWIGAVGISAVIAVAVAGWLIAGSAGAAVGLSAAMLSSTTWWLVRQHRQVRKARERSDQVTEACQLLAGLLRVGHVPTVALRLASADSAVFAEAAAGHGVGGSVVAALRRQSQRPGAAGLAQLATAWEVAERTGASLTATLDALQDRLDDGRAVTRLVAAELAAPRATGRLLAALPFFGLALGYGMGGDPGAFLLATPFGQACLVLGVALVCVGVWWIERIATKAEGQAWTGR